MNDVETIKSRHERLEGSPTAVAEVLFQHLRQYNATTVLQFGARGLDALYIARALKTAGGSVTVIDDYPEAIQCGAQIEAYEDGWPGELANVFRLYPYDMAAERQVQVGEMYDAVYVNYRHQPTWYDTALSITFANAMLRCGGWLIMNGYRKSPDYKTKNVWDSLVRTDSRYWNFTEVGDLAFAQRAAL